MSSRSTYIHCRPITFNIPAKQLGLNAYRKRLVLVHTGGGLGMKHYPVVLKSPSRSPGDLFSNNSILYPQPVMRKWLFVKDMTEFPIKTLPLIVTYNHISIFNTESVIIILIQRVPGKLYIPVLQIVPIEKLDPVFLLIRLYCRFARR